MQINKCRWFVVHYASLTCNSMQQLILIIGLKSLLWLPGVRGFIAAYIGCNPSSSNSHPHRVCSFRTLSTELDSNADDQYSLLKRIRDLTNWANENHVLNFIPLQEVIWHRIVSLQTHHHFGDIISFSCLFSANWNMCVSNPPKWICSEPASILKVG